MSGSTIIETVNHIQSIILKILPIMLSYCILSNNCFLWYQFEILYYIGNMVMVCDEMKYCNTLKTTDQSISNECHYKYHQTVTQMWTYFVWNLILVMFFFISLHKIEQHFVEFYFVVCITSFVNLSIFLI
jgi:hypothetical protein